MTAHGAGCKFSQDFTPRFAACVKSSPASLSGLAGTASPGGKKWGEGGKGAPDLWPKGTCPDTAPEVGSGGKAPEQWVSSSTILWNLCIRRSLHHSSKSIPCLELQGHGRHSPGSYLETLCFTNRAGWGPPFPPAHTPNLQLQFLVLPVLPFVITSEIPSG